MQSRILRAVLVLALVLAPHVSRPESRADAQTPALAFILANPAYVAAAASLIIAGGFVCGETEVCEELTTSFLTAAAGSAPWVLDGIIEWVAGGNTVTTISSWTGYSVGDLESLYDGLLVLGFQAFAVAETLTFSLGGPQLVVTDPVYLRSPVMAGYNVGDVLAGPVAGEFTTGAQHARASDGQLVGTAGLHFAWPAYRSTAISNSSVRLTRTAGTTGAAGPTTDALSVNSATTPSAFTSSRTFGWIGNVGEAHGYALDIVAGANWTTIGDQSYILSSVYGRHAGTTTGNHGQWFEVLPLEAWAPVLGATGYPAHWNPDGPSIPTNVARAGTIEAATGINAGLDPNATIVGADGQVYPVLTPTAAVPVGEVGLLTGIWNGITGLPSSIGAHIATLFVPKEGIQLRLEAQWNQWRNRAPIVFVVAVVAALASFAALVVATEPDPFCLPLEFRDLLDTALCVPPTSVEGVLSSFRLVSGFAIVLMWAGYMVNLYRRLLQAE